MFHSPITSVLLLGAALFAAPLHATTRTWPGGAPCDGTLQACIDAAVDGDRIEIATDEPIVDGIALHSRSLVITAADGHSPLFRNVGIVVNDSGPGGDLQVSISGLHFEHGFLYATYAGTGTATYDLRELVFTDAPGVTSSGLRVIAYDGTVDATLYDNRITGLPPTLNGGLIDLSAQGGTLDVSAYYNHVHSTSTASASGAGIFVDITGAGSAGTIKLHANEVRGRFDRAGIFLSEGLFSSAPTSFDARVYSNVVIGTGTDAGAGISLVPNDGSIDAQLVNNTVTSMRTGISLSNWDGATTPQITGMAKNNLVRADRAMAINPAFVDDFDNDYNLFNGATINFTPGPHTITADAALVSDALPRLRADSPAIDAADTATLGLGLIFNTLPVTDADGLRRIKTATTGTKADIGAYEYGDTSFMHTATGDSISGHITWLDEPSVDDDAAANLFVTPNFNAGGSGGVANNHPFGTWYFGGWSLFNENTAVAMPPGSHFDVFSAAPGSGVFRHVSTADSVSGAFSQLADSSVDNLPDRIVLATQNYSAGAVYNPHPLGLLYFAFGGPGAWLVANLDDAPMPTGAGFNIYAQEPSPNAFRVTATAGNRSGTQGLVLHHPLLDGVPCAQPIVTRLYDGTPADSDFDVYYGGGRWVIFAYGSLPLGTPFNVLVNPAQVAACTDVIFADGFD